jgi:hypothetical protein
MGIMFLKKIISEIMAAIAAAGMRRRYSILQKVEQFLRKRVCIKRTSIVRMISEKIEARKTPIPILAALLFCLLFFSADLIVKKKIKRIKTEMMDGWIIFAIF